jgi:peptidyl-prolyl cis-trans isomerase B (cyclophilin B)
MKSLVLTALFSLSLIVVTGCGDEQKPADSAKPAPATTPTAEKKGDVAIIKTSEGDMVVEFWRDAAPKTVENFETLAKKGFYDGTAFHRIVKGFMIQGGDPLTKDTNAPPASYGSGGPDYSVKAEFNDHSHVRGVLSMARSQDPDSAGSQFFICLAPATSLDHQYTAFGHLIKGDDVLEKLGNTPCTGPNAMGEMATPVKRVAVESIKIVPADSVK